MRSPSLTAGLALVRPRKILLVHKRQDRPHAGWGIPKGHQEPGELLRMTAVREVFEETSIQVRLSLLVGDARTMHRIKRGRLTSILHYWVIDVRNCVIPDVLPASWLQLTEIDAARFMGVEAARACMPPYSHPMLSVVPME